MVILLSSGHSDMFRDHMIYAAILLQIAEAKGSKIVSGRETEHHKHMPPLMTGAYEVESSCNRIIVTS